MNFDIYNYFDSDQFFRNLLSRKQQQQGSSTTTSNAASPHTSSPTHSQSSSGSTSNGDTVKDFNYCYGLGQRTPDVPFIFTKLSNISSSCFECLEYDVPIVKNDENNVIPAFDYIFTDFFRENIIRLTNGSFRCQLDGIRFNNERETIEHMKHDHKTQIFETIALLAEDHETNYMGNFFTKLMYSDVLYSIRPQVKSQQNNITLTEYPSVLAPTLPPQSNDNQSDSSKSSNKTDGKKKSKRSKKIKVKPKVCQTKIFPRDELSELSRSLFGEALISSNDNVTISNFKSVSEILASHKNESEEARMKREQAIFNDCIMKIQKINQSEPDVPETATSTASIAPITTQNPPPTQQISQEEEEWIKLEAELCEEIYDEVLDEICSTLIKKFDSKDKKKKQKEMEREKEKLEKERLELEKQNNEEVLLNTIDDLVEDLLDEMICDDLFEMCSQQFNDLNRIRLSKQQQQQPQQQQSSNSKGKSTTPTKLNLKVDEKIPTTNTISTTATNIAGPAKVELAPTPLPLPLPIPITSPPPMVKSNVKSGLLGDYPSELINGHPMNILPLMMNPPPASAQPNQSINTNIPVTTVTSTTIPTTASTPQSNIPKISSPLNVSATPFHPSANGAYASLLKQQSSTNITSTTPPVPNSTTVVPQSNIQPSPLPISQNTPVYMNSSGNNTFPIQTPTSIIGNSNGPSPLPSTPNKSNTIGTIGGNQQQHEFVNQQPPTFQQSTADSSVSFIKFLQSINFNPDLTVLCRASSLIKNIYDLISYFPGVQVSYTEQGPKVQQMNANSFDQDSLYLIQFETIQDLERSLAINFPSSPITVTRIVNQFNLSSLGGMLQPQHQPSLTSPPTNSTPNFGNNNILSPKPIQTNVLGTNSMVSNPVFSNSFDSPFNIRSPSPPNSRMSISSVGSGSSTIKSPSPAPSTASTNSNSNIAPMLPTNLHSQSQMLNSENDMVVPKDDYGIRGFKTPTLSSPSPPISDQKRNSLHNITSPPFGTTPTNNPLGNSGGSMTIPTSNSGGGLSSIDLMGLGAVLPPVGDDNQPSNLFGGSSGLNTSSLFSFSDNLGLFNSSVFSPSLNNPPSSTSNSSQQQLDQIYQSYLQQQQFNKR